MITNRGCAMGPCGTMDAVGMKTCFDILSHWGEVNKDDQMLANARYIKEHFLEVPDISKAEEIARPAQTK